MIPNRIRTGYKDRTIPAPAQLAGTETFWGSFATYRAVYEGAAKGYDFLKQTKNFEGLRAALERNGIRFTEVSAILYDGDRGYNQRFVALTSNPNVLWYKYVGFIAQSGQNHIFIHGRRIKVSYFLAASPVEQDALLSGDEHLMEQVLGEKRMKFLDEAAAYWN